MKIWLIDHYAVPPKYFPLARNTNFARELIKQGHEVRIFAASSIHNTDRKNLITDKRDYIELEEDGVPYTLVRCRSYVGNGVDRITNFFEFPHRLKKVLKHYELPDAMITQSITPMAAMVGVDFAHQHGLKGHIQVTDLWPESFVALGILGKKNPLLPFLYAYEKRLYEKADSITFSMEGGKDYIIGRGWDNRHGGSIDLNKVHYINNGIDLAQFDFNKEHYQIKDEDLDNPDIFKLVYTGSIRKANCVEKILPVAEYFQNKGEKRVKFLIWGAGDSVGAIQKEIEEKKLTNVVLKGRVEKKFIPSIVSKADANFWILEDTPLYRFGISMNKSFDYLAAGKPLLLFSDCGYSVVEQYHCGIHCHENNSKAYINAVENMVAASSKQYKEMCKNARVAASEYDFSVLTEKLIKILES